MSSASPISSAVRRDIPTYPLDEFYRLAGRTLPEVQAVAAAALPAPYHDLLAHEQDMTSTLEKFHGERIHLALVSAQQLGDAYFREVVLMLDGSRRPVEFGAIKIYLNRFAPAPRRLILEGHLPLGRILHDSSVPYVSRPQAFLKIQADAFIAHSLHLQPPVTLFGRRNTLSNPQGEPLAEIVEILPN